MIPFGRGLYPLVYFGLLLIVPGIVIFDDPSVVPIVGAIVVWLITLLPVYFCHLPGLPFLQALSVLTRHLSSGCANITLIYIWMPIFYYWLIAFCMSLQGVFKGRAISQRLWSAYLEKRSPDLARFLSSRM